MIEFRCFFFRPCCDFLDLSDDVMNHVYTIPIENIGEWRRRTRGWSHFFSKSRVFTGDKKAIGRVNQAKPSKIEQNEKSIQAQVRRQRRFDGLQLFEKTKLNRWTVFNLNVKRTTKRRFRFSLIIASKYDSLSILQHLIEYMDLASHFVIYSQSVNVSNDLIHRWKTCCFLFRVFWNVINF